MNGVYSTTYYEFYEKTMNEFSQIDEGWRDAARSMVAAGALGLMPFTANGEDKPRDVESKDKIEQVSDADEKIGNWDKSKLINIVARTLFMEARQDYRNEGLKAVASVIWNRADHDPKNVVSVCFAKNQFSVWLPSKPWENPAYEPNTYKPEVPPQTLNNKIEEAAWKECVKFATEMANNTFVSNIGNRNMYDFGRTDKNKSWFDAMRDKKVFGSQTFGYLPTAGKVAENPQRKKPKVYVVARGDTLTGIAKKNKVSYAELLRKNPKYAKNPDSINPGDKIILPEKNNG